MTINPYIGTKIKELREQLGMTSDELAEKLGKSKSTVRMWELSKSQPTAATCVKLGKLFHVSCDYLLSADDAGESQKATITVHKNLNAAFLGNDAEDGARTEPLRESMAMRGGYIAAEIENSRFTPTFLKGDIIIIHLQDACAPWDVAVVTDDEGDITLKHVEADGGGLWLIDIMNGKKDIPVLYSPEEMKEKGIKVLGRVAELRRRF
ncbi:MAG: helix-turn-helix domain-containing protein [Clostridia bacterium]|nr:helix-turn-helix domain-containing protein [Clostridia bacterium]